MAEERQKVMVGCSIPNGVELSLFREGYDDGSGVFHLVRDGAGVRIAGPASVAAGTLDPALEQGAGETEVDAEWFEAWLAQNKKNPWVIEKRVYLIEPEGERARHDSD